MISRNARKKTLERSRSPLLGQLSVTKDVKQGGKTLPRNPKETTDRVYFVQNENEVLKLKNFELDEQVRQLTNEHLREQDKARTLEVDCSNIEEQLRREKLSPEIALATEKKRLEEQMALLETNYQMWERKIVEVQAAMLQQEETIPMLLNKKEQADMDLWRVRMQAEGMKVVVSKLEKEIEQLRKDNEQLAKNRKHYGPEEQKISQQIEDQLKEMKDRNAARQHSLRKIAAAAAFKYLERLYKIKLATAVLTLRLRFQGKTVARKVLFSALHTSGSYVRFIKSKALGKFKRLIEPLKQTTKLEGIIASSHRLRVKASIFAGWRREFIKTQYSLIRKLQVLTSLDKLQKSFLENQRIICFNRLKHFGNRGRQTLLNVGKCFTVYKQRVLASAFESLRSFHQKKFLQDDLEHASKQQTEFLIKNLYFNAFATYVRELRPYKKYLLAKYFKALKKNKFSRNKRQLQSVMSLIVEKNTINAALVKGFAGWKHVAILEAQQSAQQARDQLAEENRNLRNQVENFSGNQTDEFRTLAFAKIGKLLWGSAKRALYRWRRWNTARTKFLSVLEFLHSKNLNDKNLGFAKIQTRRFQRLKVSIADKIQSCEFSYNYLTQQNAHIKEVLDRKTLEVEKTKFVKIIKNLINKQRSSLRKYFYRFLGRGERMWYVTLQLRRLEALVRRKLGQVFMWELRQRMETQKLEARREHTVELMYGKYERRLQRLAIQGLAWTVARNQRMKRILTFVVNRNDELKAHASYCFLKRLLVQQKDDQLRKEFEADTLRLNSTNQTIEVTEARVAVLTERLKQRTKTMSDRNIIACKLFFTRSIRNYVMHYVDRWRSKLNREKRVLNFASALQRKLRINIEQITFRKLVSNHYHGLNEQLSEKLAKFTSEYDAVVNDFNGFAAAADSKIATMKKESETNVEVAASYKRRYAHFNTIRIQWFDRKYGQYFARQLIHKWKLHLEKERVVLGKLFERLRRISGRLAFNDLTQEMRHIALVERVKRNLHKHLKDAYTHNSEYFFRTWRFQSQQSGQKHKNVLLKEANERRNRTQQTLEERITKFEALCTEVFVDKELRRILIGMRTFAKMKIAVREKAKVFSNQLKTSGIKEFFTLLRHCTLNRIKLKHQFAELDRRRNNKLARLFMQQTMLSQKRRELFERCFLGRALYQLYFNYARDAFASIKKYHRYKEIYLLDKHTHRLQLLIQAIDKKRKIVIGEALRKWRKYEYIRVMKVNLMRRLTRRAMNKRIELCFYNWRLEAQARTVVEYHGAEGEVRKREREFQRSKRYIEDLKRQKGLLLQNEQGNLVMSPKFMEKRESQKKIENTNRYRLVSRLLMFANGESNTIRAWNNLHVYYIMRTKVKQNALLTLNYLRNPQQLKAFRRWRTLVKDEKEMLQTMSRDELIKVLQKQKSKLEIEYSRKIGNEEVMNREIQKFEQLERLSETHERLCASVLTRFARRKKETAFNRWRDVLLEEQQEEGNTLQSKGDARLNSLEEEIRSLQEQYEQALMINRELKTTALEGLEIAEAVRRLTIERDELNQELHEKALTCQALLEENILLNNRFNLAHEEAFQLLSLTKN